MSGDRGSPWAWLVPGVTLATWLAADVLLFLPRTGEPAAPGYYVVHSIPYIAYAAVGGLIIRARRAARVGWVLGGIGLLEGVSVLIAEVAARLAAVPGGRAAAQWLIVVTSPVPIAATALIVVLLLVFPDGRLASPRWRWVLVVVGVECVVVLAASLTDPSAPSGGVPGLPVGPLADAAVSSALAPLASFWLFPVLVLVAAASLVQRYRAGTAVVRSQLKWLALAAFVLALCEIGNNVLGVDTALAGVLDTIGKLAVAAAIGIAVLRHRLYDVDRAISRALVYGWLAVLVTGIYVVLVVGVGSALGHPAGPDLLLSVVATIVVALASLPLRSRLQEAANRLVYGRRQAPYDSLAGFTRRLAERSEGADLVAAIAQALGEGLRARAAAVHLRDGAPVGGTWPAGTPLPATPPTGAAPVTHHGEDLGTLEVWTDAELTEAEQRLLADLAHQVGLVLRNAALSSELRQRLRELRASRLRLVAAQDAERRRFERDLHDGAQQELLTARMKLGTAERLAADLAPEVADLLREVHDSTAATLESMRRLARGLNPPLLQSHGLLTALIAHARRLPLPTEVRGTDQRLPADVETAVWFCCAEALQNVVKHAGARTARVVVDGGPGTLCFEVGDDGCGFGVDGATVAGAGLQNMADRLEALGGRLEVRSDAGGTRVTGVVPLPRTSDTPERAGAAER